MSEIETAAPAKKETVYTAVLMDDGRTVSFAGTRLSNKTVDATEGVVTVRIDFANGRSISLSTGELAAETILTATGHGLSQKLGDSYASEKSADDMFLAAEDMTKRLVETGWAAPRAAGDSFAGAGIVIRAVCEVTGKTPEFVKAFLAKKLETAKTRGEKLSRADLYQSFRDPASPTGKVIKRLEDEQVTKTAKFKASDLLDEVNAE